ncbi:uncharacterized protein [Dermacentor albipictus]|uniref:uncharacterized protein isoform X2 n=1 Tax=Dermacentor albipictus TaxID=60249 RepID=UPI0031FDBFEF
MPGSSAAGKPVPTGSAMSSSSDSSFSETSSSSSECFDTTSTTSTSFSDQEDGALFVAAGRLVNRSSVSNNRPPRRVRLGPDRESTVSYLEALDEEEEDSSGTPKERCSICLVAYRETDTLKRTPLVAPECPGAVRGGRRKAVITGEGSRKRRHKRGEEAPCQ